MMKTNLFRALALMLVLALLGGMALAEPVELMPEGIEVPVQEEAEFALAPAEEPAPVEEIPAEEVLPEALAPMEAEAPEAPDLGEQMVAAGEASADGTRAFSATAAVESEVWQNVNLVRAEGFTGPLAQVSGTLTLQNALIDGRPAREADLSAYFAFGPTGAIAIQDDAPLQLSLSGFSFNKGSKVTLSMAVNGVSVPVKKAKWATTDRKVAKVSRGKISAKGAGAAVITATYEGLTAACLVVVTDYKQVKSLKMSSRKLKLALFGGQQLGLTIKPADAYQPAITWTSSNPAVVSVDANGFVAGLSGGTATVTAVSGNGKKAKCKVTVEEIKPTGIRFAQSYVSLEPGNTFATQIALTPETVSNPAVSFASSDPSVASVDENGVVTVNNYGAAVITAVCAADPSVKATCRVSVLQPGHKRMEGLTIGINPGHQKKTIAKLYPLAPGSHAKAKGVKTGACGKWSRVPEYETNLQIGLKLAALCSDAGATVVITRTSNDVMLTNIDRARMLNEACVDVALQLHCNSVSNSRSEGNSAYIRTTTPYADVNRAIGECITAAISAETGCKNLGVKICNTYMSLNWTETPSCLLEMGYLSNKNEDALLATDDYRNKVALGIFEGLCAYFGR